MEDGVTQMGPKVDIEVILHDWIAKISLGGVSRQNLWKNLLEICCQICIMINEWREWSDLYSKSPINLACWYVVEYFAFWKVRISPLIFTLFSFKPNICETS